jgi:hypothetical protein
MQMITRLFGINFAVFQLYRLELPVKETPLKLSEADNSPLHKEAYEPVGILEF